MPQIPAGSRVLSRHVLDVGYKHAGTSVNPWEHRFGRDVEMHALPSGQILLSHPTKKLWTVRDFDDNGIARRATFLENPPMRKRKSHRRPATRRAVTKGSRRRAASRRTTSRRRPPKGFRSIKAFLDSIRPGGRKSKRARATGGIMKRRRKKNTPARARRRRHHNAPRHLRRRRHRNPPGGLIKEAGAFALEVVVGSAGAIGGEVFARKGLGLLKQAPDSVPGQFLEGGIGVLGGLLIGAGSRFVRNRALSTGIRTLGMGFAIGGVSSAARRALQNRFKAFGDLGDGYYVGGNSGLQLVSAEPDDYAGRVGDVGDESGLGGFVSDRGGSSIVEGYLNSINDNAA